MAEFEITGDASVFDRLKLAAQQAMKNAAETILMAIQAEARQNVPKSTSALMQSIDYRMDPTTDTGIEAVVGCMGANSVYARAIEYGLKPGHYMPRRAIEGPLANWVRLKGLTGNKGRSKSNMDEAESIAWAISKTIAANGTRAQPFMYPAINHGLSRFQAFLDAEIQRMRMK